MPARRISANIAGRVKKIKTADFLVPLFEAITNSIQAIEAVPQKPGRITVDLLREPRQGDLAIEKDTPITGFVITDNGIGFDEANMASFCEADSNFKEKQGGKGIGRFSWLKFFEVASVDSIYANGSKRRRRTFTFSVNGIDEKPVVEVESEPRTIIKLAPLHANMESKTRKSLEHVSIELIEHFIAYFVTGSMPTVEVRDGAASEDIGQLYRGSIGKNTTNYHLSINGHAFEATGLKFFPGTQTHTAFLCADKRVAEKIPLGKRDQFFHKRFVDDDLRTYAYYMFVQSRYLDGLVNDDRDGIRFADSGPLIASTEVTRSALTDELVKTAKLALSSEIDKLTKTNIATVTSFVATDAPQYRHLITRHREAVSQIHDTDKLKIDQALRRLQFEDELKTRADISALLQGTEQATTESAKEEWKKKSAEALSKLNEEGKANLAGYIVQRRLILDLLKKRMEIDDGGYAREEAVHQLIFPMRTTSDDVNYEDQNLWIIDERLSYHYYLASDKPLVTIPPAESKSKKEPDVIVFNRPIALNDRPEGERLESIVIVEFKRPGVPCVDGVKNPVDQVLEYIELIKEGRATNRKGRPINPARDPHFFCYVICELDALLKRVLIRKTMRETPDGEGMFGFFPDHRAYVEVISYDKMLKDAFKRNRILFDKLQLPSQ